MKRPFCDGLLHLEGGLLDSQVGFFERRMQRQYLDVSQKNGSIYRLIYLTNRFQVAVRLSSNRSQMTSKCGKNKKEAHEVTDCLTTYRYIDRYIYIYIYLFISCIQHTISILIGRKHTVYFRNQPSGRHLPADYTIITLRTLKVTNNHVMYDRDF